MLILTLIQADGLIAEPLSPKASAPVAVFATTEAPHHGTLLKARLGDQEGLFLFDTGAGVTIVTPTAAHLAGCKPWGQMTGFRATGARIDMPRCDNVYLSIGGQRFHIPSAALFDINALINDKSMPKVYGLVALDTFAGRIITIRPRAHEIVLETAASLQSRIQHAHEIPIRIVRDTEGLALSIDAAVPTAAGLAWMELDTGNLGPVMVGRHLAVHIGLNPAEQGLQTAKFSIGDVAHVEEPARVSDLIMDGDIGESVLINWDITLDLGVGRGWLQPSTVKVTQIP